MMSISFAYEWETNLLARKVKLKSNKELQKGIDKLSTFSTNLYNKLLEINFSNLDNGDKILSPYDMVKLIRSEQISSDIKDRICVRVYDGLKRYVESEKLKYYFFQAYGVNYRKKLKEWCTKKGIKLFGRPRFKTKPISLQYLVRKTSQKTVQVFGKYTSVNIPTLGKAVGFNDRQELFGHVKQVTISKDHCNTYWATIISDGEKPKNNIVPPTQDIAIDLGLKHTITCANAEITIQPERERFFDKQIKTIQRSSRNYRRALPYIHRKIARRRKHSHHVMAKQIIQSAQTIYVGNLNSQFLFSSILARSASDAAHYQFKQILNDKAANAGHRVIIVNESYTSQTCFSCKQRRKIELSEREFFCNCGYKNNRDVNACLNILEIGRSLNSRETTAGA